MKCAYARVVSSEPLYGQTHLLWLSAPDVSRGAAPGQFLMLRCTDQGPGDVAATFSAKGGPAQTGGRLAAFGGRSPRHPPMRGGGGLAP
jgi:NAD(P)H-flavin reductase